MVLNLSNPQNILVIRLTSLGDVILTTPVVRALRRRYPDTQIDFLTTPGSRDVYVNNPNITNLWLYDKRGDRSELFNQLKDQGYDFVLDLHKNRHSKRINKKLAKKVFQIKKPQLNKLLLVKFKINRFKKIVQIPDRYASALPGLQLDEYGPEIFPPGLDEVEQDVNLIGFCPGSKHFTKQYPEEYYVKLGKILNDKGYRIALFGGNDDREICSRIDKSLENSINLSNNNNLIELLLGLKKCRLVVCNDSGLMHSATAVKVPVVAIFGSTVGELGFKPWNSDATVIEDNSVKCRPCSHIGKSHCPKSHFNCMKNITPENVFDNISKILNI